MIAKAKAISHGDRAIEYAMRPSKNSELIKSNLIQESTPEKIYREFAEIQKYNSRCRNKFIRIEIGIAPNDQAKLSNEQLKNICTEFSKRFGFENYQWIACTHQDTDNLHLHMIVNRISVNQSVFDTSFISKKAGIIAEKISRDMGLTIANQIISKNKKHTDVVSFERMLARAKIENLSQAALSNKPLSLSEFRESMKENDIEVTEMKNKNGNTYGLRFTGYGETFKGSTVGKEFGYYTLMESINSNVNNFQVENNPNNEVTNSVLTQNINLARSISSLLNNDLMDDEEIEDDLEQKKEQTKKRKYV